MGGHGVYGHCWLACRAVHSLAARESGSALTGSSPHLGCTQVNRMKVPRDALLGHAFHTYQLVSPDGTVTFEFQVGAPPLPRGVWARWY